MFKPLLENLLLDDRKQNLSEGIGELAALGEDVDKRKVHMPGAGVGVQS